MQLTQWEERPAACPLQEPAGLGQEGGGGLGSSWQVGRTPSYLQPSSRTLDGWTLNLAHTHESKVPLFF